MLHVLDITSPDLLYQARQILPEMYAEHAKYSSSSVELTFNKSANFRPCKGGGAPPEAMGGAIGVAALLGATKLLLLLPIWLAKGAGFAGTGGGGQSTPVPL